MKLAEKDYLVGLAGFNGIGPKRFLNLQKQQLFYDKHIKLIVGKFPNYL